MIVKPVPGRRVRDPDTMAILQDETEVPNTSFWQRRLVEGDVSLVEAKPPKEAKK